MFVSQTIRLSVNDESKKVLDDASKRVTKLYNKLVRFASTKMNEEGKRCFITYAALQSQVNIIADGNDQLRELNPCLRTAAAYTLYEGIKKFNSGYTEFPKFKSNTFKWTSLFFTHKERVENDVVINGREVSIKIGINNPIIINGRLKKDIVSNKRIVNYRITKEANKYYLVISIDKEYKKAPKTGKSIAIDLNHSNFFMAIDSEGMILEMENLPMIRYFATKIDEVSTLRGKCQIKKEVNSEGIPYNIYSRRYKRLTKTINRLEYKRKVQIRTALYMIANKLTDKYDTIAIGDYTPTKDDALNTAMRRSMLNLSVVSQFRTILAHVCKKRGRALRVVNEYGTTMTCHSCGYVERKAPDVRSYICPKCQAHYLRDVNSAINIGTKARIFLPHQFASINLLKPTYTISYNLFNQSLDFKRIMSY